MADFRLSDYDTEKDALEAALQLPLGDWPPQVPRSEAPHVVTDAVNVLFGNCGCRHKTQTDLATHAGAKLLAAILEMQRENERRSNWPPGFIGPFSLN